ncbi:hypothetical protein VTL71DRAFT_10482 [Oculimacula yallundae]|uniref:Cell wall galactomannoprotein n=1 Tax=Oculimacula yallundae TaxID=86028 RepID=A0ABR4CT53_9HELO
MYITSTLLLSLTLLIQTTTSCPSPLFVFSSSEICPLSSPASTPPQIQQPTLPVSPLIAAISSITTLLNTLSTTARVYDGTLQQTFDLAKIVGKLKAQLGRTTAELGNLEEEEGFVGGEGNENVIDVLREMVEDVGEVLDVLVVKAPMIATAGYTSLVSSELITLSASTDLLFIALRAKMVSSSLVSGDAVEEVIRLQKSVDEAFKKAGKAFEEKKDDLNDKVVGGSGNGARERRANQFVNIAVGFH